MVGDKLGGEILEGEGRVIEWDIVDAGDGKKELTVRVLGGQRLNLLEVLYLRNEITKIIQANGGQVNGVELL